MGAIVGVLYPLKCPWYQATKDIRAVQRLLGHADITTTERYVLTDDDSMRAAVLAVA